MYNRIEMILTNLAGACIAGALFVTFAGDAHARINDATSPVTINAINALYVAGDVAQRAIDVDVCGDDDTHVAGDALQGDDARQYRIVRDALGVAFNASHGGDNAVEIVRNEFCAGVGER